MTQIFPISRRRMAASAVACAAILSFASAARADNPIGVATSLYRDFAWEVVFAVPTQPSFIDQPRAVLDRYLTPELAAAIHADRACAARTHAICRLDFDPLWDSQDPSASGLRLTPGPELSRVDVSFNVPDGRRTVIQLHLRQTRAGWRIDDFVGHEGRSLKAVLRGR